MADKSLVQHGWDLYKGSVGPVGADWQTSVDEQNRAIRTGGQVRPNTDGKSLWERYVGSIGPIGDDWQRSVNEQNRALTTGTQVQATPGPLPTAIGGGNAGASVQPELGDGGYAKLQQKWKNEVKTNKGTRPITVDTASVGGGINTSATRAPREDVLATPTSVEQALSYMDPSAYGGRRLGDLNTAGFIEADAFTTGDRAKAGEEFATGVKNTSSIVGSSLGKDTDVNKFAGAFTGSAENAGDAFTKAPDVVFNDKPRDGMAALRQSEKNAGVVYASGAYWMDGPDGKLQKIEQDYGNKRDSYRTQALAFAASQGDAGVKPAETAKTTFTGGELPGGSPFVAEAKPGIATDMNFGKAIEAREGLGDVKGLTGTQGREKMQQQIAKARETIDTEIIKLNDSGNTFPRREESLLGNLLQ